MQVQYTVEFIARFWSKVTKTETCWLWIGATSKAGYGQIKLGGRKGKLLYAHRVAFELAGGVFADGYRSLHTCDVPACVRNDDTGAYVVNEDALQRFGHLFAGTQAHNMADMQAKARGCGGETHRAVMRNVAARGDRNGSRTHPERMIGRKRRPFTIRPDLVRRGMQSAHVRLTDDNVREIRRAFAAGESTQVILANHYGVTQTNISRIVKRITWKHI